MDREAVVAKIVEIVEQAEDPAAELGVEEVTEAQPDLYLEALDHFERWDQALIAALVELAQQQDDGSARGARRAPSDVERRVTDENNEPVFVNTSEGSYFAMPAYHLRVRDEPRDFVGLDEHGGLDRVEHIGDPDAVFLISDQGRLFGLDVRIVPKWSGIDGPSTHIRTRLGLDQGEHIRFAVSRRALYSERFIHITANGKGKATDGEEIRKHFDNEGREAFKLNEGDRPISAFTAPEAGSIFCASASAQGIHFEAQDLRSMGRKAVGVNVMRLGDGEEIVSAFSTTHVRQLALISEQGYGKRLEFEEFRIQNRGGGGLQMARLGTGDALAAVVPCSPSKDLLLFTSLGRLWRRPTVDFQFLGRAARGDRVIELEDGERVTGLAALPCGPYSADGEDEEE